MIVAHPSERTVPTPAGVLPRSHWISVVTHLDPRFGGLSAAVPQLGSAVVAAGSVSLGIAAFCVPGEIYLAPTGPEITLTEWPAGRSTWFKDPSLSPRFDGLLAGAAGVHIHGLWEQSTYVSAARARALQVPYVVSAHGMLERWALRNRRWKKWIYSLLIERNNLAGASCLHALTQAEAEDYRRFGCRRPIAVIPNGVVVPDRLSSDLFFAQHPSLRGKRIVLFLGRIHAKKGLTLLVKAWKQLFSDNAEAHLVIAGPDSEGTAANLIRAVAEAGMAHSITFTGMLRGEAKWSALCAAECFILPSFSEGLSVSVLEAMGAGLPVILSEHCNLPEVAAHEAGWVIPATAPAIETSLRTWLEDKPALNRERGRRGQRLVARHYTWEVVARRMAEVYAWVEGGTLPSQVEILGSEGAA